jgi:hypothetical protein
MKHVVILVAGGDGFLKLVNSNAKVLALVYDFGCTHLLTAQSQPPPSDDL